MTSAPRKLAPGSSSAPQFELIARDMAARIRSGEFRTGHRIPTTTVLAGEYGVSRGTVRHALQCLATEHGLLTARGARWVVHDPTLTYSVEKLRSFAQWAEATGRKPSGLTISMKRGRATALEAAALSIQPGSFVLRCVRVRSLDDEPVMTEHSVYTGGIAACVEKIARDVPSVMTVLEERFGIALGHAEYRMAATEALSEDHRLLGVPRRSPILRIRRTSRTTDGSAFEFSEDRYAADSVEFSMVTSGQ